MLIAGVANAFLAGDLFNLYVGFEILLTASYVLLTLGGTAPRIRAGVTYIVVSLLSSLLFLAAIALVYAATGTVNMAQLAGRLAELPDGTQLLLQSMLLIAFCIKAAVFPLSAWLPDSYPTAPAPVTAVFAGLLTKVGVYAIIRTQTLLFPGGALDDVLMWAALATMVVGILGAVAQTDIRRILSFTLVSHIGYMVFGIALATAAGLAGAIFYVAHHIAIQTTLFLVAGPDRAAGRLDRGRPARRAGQGLAAAGGAVLRPGDEPGRHPAVLRVHRQARAAARPASPTAAGCRYVLVAGGVADQPAHPGGHRPGLEPGLLAAAGAVPGRGHRRAAAADAGPEPGPRRPRPTTARPDGGRRRRAVGRRAGRAGGVGAAHRGRHRRPRRRPTASGRRRAGARPLRPLPG